MVDDIMFYIRLRREQLRYELERYDDYPPFRKGLIQGNLDELNDMERIIKDADKNAKVGR